MQIHLVFEDELTGFVLSKMIACLRSEIQIGAYRRMGGKGNIRRNINVLNNAAKKIPFFVLVDLDKEYSCAPELMRDWFKSGKSAKMHFRVAVRAVESWILASRTKFADYLSIDCNEIPANTDNINDPKAFLIRLARLSKKKLIKQDLIPLYQGTAKVGPNYNGRLADFVNRFWDYTEAEKHSESFRRTLNLIKII